MFNNWNVTIVPILLNIIFLHDPATSLVQICSPKQINAYVAKRFVCMCSEQFYSNYVLTENIPDVQQQKNEKPKIFIAYLYHE